jgi:hypothetical protein
MLPPMTDDPSDPLMTTKSTTPIARFDIRSIPKRPPSPSVRRRAAEGGEADEPRALMALALRRASISRASGSWSETDFDVFDGEHDVGRIFRQPDGQWFWGVSFQLTGRKSYGHAPTLEEASVQGRV